MRVTNKMMIDNTKYWISKQAERLSDAETISASGKQVNKPSDNPDAAAKILEYRSAIAEYSQYESNITQADTWIQTGEEVMNSVDSLLDQAKEITCGYSSAESDTKTFYIKSLKNIYDQIIDLANTKCDLNYMYSGSQSDTIPFSDTTSVSSGSAEDIGYYLTADASNVSITISDSSGNDVRTLTASGTSGSNSLPWDGKDNSGNALSDGDYTFTISASDSSDNMVASSCYQGDSGSKTIIYGNESTASLNTDGGDIFSTAFTALNKLTSALKSGSNDDISTATASITSAINKIKAERVALSNVYSQLGATTDRLDKLSELFKEKLSTIETGSTEEAAVALSTQETAYETTISATSKILDMKNLSAYI